MMRAFAVLLRGQWFVSSLAPTRGYSKKEKNDRFPSEELILITAREDSAITSQKITSHEVSELRGCPPISSEGNTCDKSPPLFESRKENNNN